MGSKVSNTSSYPPGANFQTAQLENLHGREQSLHRKPLFYRILGLIMSLDFFVTHFYRLVVHDVVLMSDVYWFYTAGRREGQSVQEFAEVLVGITFLTTAPS
jgi:hypothetical protein